MGSIPRRLSKAFRLSSFLSSLACLRESKEPATFEMLSKRWVSGGSRSCWSCASRLDFGSFGLGVEPLMKFVYFRDENDSENGKKKVFNIMSTACNWGLGLFAAADLALGQFAAVSENMNTYTWKLIIVTECCLSVLLKLQ